jgi:hypothetical protein
MVADVLVGKFQSVEPESVYADKLSRPGIQVDSHFFTHFAFDGLTFCFARNVMPADCHIDQAGAHVFCLGALLENNGFRLRID